MKAKTIFFVFTMLAGSPLAYAQWHVQLDSEVRGITEESVNLQSFALETVMLACDGKTILRWEEEQNERFWVFLP